jgi:hypothetical protein
MSELLKALLGSTFNPFPATSSPSSPPGEIIDQIAGEIAGEGSRDAGGGKTGSRTGTKRQIRVRACSAVIPSASCAP